MKKKRKKKEVDIGERPLKYIMDGGNLVVDGQLVKSKNTPEPTVRKRRVRRGRRKRQAYVPSSIERLNTEYKALRAKKRREEKRANS
jgi:hypothetical protein